MISIYLLLPEERDPLKVKTHVLLRGVVLVDVTVDVGAAEV